MMNKMILMAAAAITLAAGAQVANARDYQIVPDISVTGAFALSAFVVKDNATGAVLASWHKTTQYTGGVWGWFFHDPSNLINVHLGPNGVIDWNLN
jgi:hypothetical protein